MEDLIKSCEVCPRKCHAKRNRETGDGFCKMGSLPRIAKVSIHYGEEPCISDGKGSGTIFFSGCTLRCVYCQNFDISSQAKGKVYSIKDLVNIFKYLEKTGVNNINLVNPTHFAEAIIEALCIYKPNIPIVYNSSGYENLRTLERLDKLIDIYLLDLKYYDNDIAKTYSNVDNYFEIAKEAVLKAVDQVGEPKFYDTGIMQSGVIVRHLVLPNHIKNSIDVLKWIHENINDRALVSIMSQYTPLGKAKNYIKINRPLTKREYKRVENFIIDTDLDGFFQDLSSVGSEYVPDFNDEGLLKYINLGE